MKSDLRISMFRKRTRIPPRERARASRIIAESVLALTAWQEAKRVCVYRSLPSEVDTAELISEAEKQHKTVLPPAPAITADLFIVPGVAFDRLGWRLGRGAGFYDRLLAGTASLKIGLAFEKQMVAEVPHFSYDVPMDMVVTERGRYGKAKAS